MRNKYLLHVFMTAGVTDDAALLTEQRLGGLTVEGEAALRHADHLLPIHSAGSKHKLTYNSVLLIRINDTYKYTLMMMQSEDVDHKGEEKTARLSVCNKTKQQLLK